MKKLNICNWYEILLRDIVKNTQIKKRDKKPLKYYSAACYHWTTYCISNLMLFFIAIRKYANKVRHFEQLVQLTAINTRLWIRWVFLKSINTKHILISSSFKSGFQFYLGCCSLDFSFIALHKWKNLAVLRQNIRTLNAI